MDEKEDNDNDIFDILILKDVPLIFLTLIPKDERFPMISFLKDGKANIFLETKF